MAECQKQLSKSWRDGVLDPHDDEIISWEDDPWNEMNASKPYMVLWYCRHDAGVYQSH